MASTRPIQPEDLLAIKTIADVQLSPDGTRVAYVLTEIDAEKDEYRSAIWIAPAAGGAPIQFTRGPKHDSAPRWSPDGAYLAFLSDRDGAASQLYVMPVHGGEPRKLTALDNGAGSAVWSPDGTRILFAARVFKETPPTDKDARERWKQRPKVVTKAQYKPDGQGYIFDALSHLFVVAVDSGEVKQIKDGDCEDRAPSWSPDGKRIAFSRARNGIADFSVSDIWVANADGGNARRITENVGRATSPTWSPDGATIACYGTDEQKPGLGDSMVRVWLAYPNGDAPLRLTANYDRAVILLPPPAITAGPMWSRDGSAVAFIVADAGNAPIVRAAIADGSVKSVVTGERQVQFASAATAANRIAFIATDPCNPSDVYLCAWDGADERRLTNVNDALLAQLTLPRVERRAFKNPNGGMIEGWVTRPTNGQEPAPLLVEIHGGPHSFAGNIFPLGYFYSYVLASRGWAVLALNPTGSGSYGKEFAHAIWGRWGKHDLPEQLAAVDALVAEGIADANRLAVSGYSYGGFMTSWMITHTDRFKAAIVGAPVVNQESMYGTSDIGMWFGLNVMKGDILTQRETYRRLSPINYVDRVTTPKLIIHGEADDRCPIGQGEELFVCLIAAGRAPTEFVRYPGESHLFRVRGKPSHRVDLSRRVVEWVERYALR